MKQRLTKRKINYIKRHYQQKSDRELAQKLGVPRALVKRVRKELNLGFQEKQPSWLPYERKPSPPGLTGRGWSRRKIVAVNLVVGGFCGRVCALSSFTGEGIPLFLPGRRSILNVVFITMDTLRADHAA